VDWVGLTDPDPGPNGPDGQVGWLGLWAKSMFYSFPFLFVFFLILIKKSCELCFLHNFKFKSNTYLNKLNLRKQLFTLK
jgi:hypothetical protein